MTQKRYDQLINSKRGFIGATIRDVLLPAILGKETDGILYWIGKDLAREYPVQSIDDLVLLTKQLGFGKLELIKNSPLQHTFKLSGPVVEERLAIDKEHTSFTLEAGFIAQELEFQLGTVTEAEIDGIKHKEVRIFAQNDPQKNVNQQETEIVEFIKLHRDADSKPDSQAKPATN
ncbi:YslB family protein [Limosilactobacillus caecicola]|uniref:YslB family protein n=1 Tax=Limosilactobacillus caecicola TaxID=2941332 RepID=UPI0020406E79|nr:YslB family protein [Limosilactobacillus caecicola]